MTPVTDSTRELLMKLLDSVGDRVEEMSAQVSGAVAAHARCREELLGKLAELDKSQARQQSCLDSIKRNVDGLRGAGAWWVKTVPLGLAVVFLMGLGSFFVRQEMILKQQAAIADDLDAIRERWNDMALAVAVLETRAEQGARQTASRRAETPEEFPTLTGEPTPPARARALRFALPASKRTKAPPKD